MGKNVAIDLGTVNSVVAVMGVYPEAGEVFNEKVTIIKDEFGSTTFPSVVGYDSELDNFIVGHIAKQRIQRPAKKNETPPVAFAKRYIGSDMKYRLGKNTYKPEEMSGYIVHELIKLTEQRLNDTVDNVLITVPAYFDNHQRELTMDAARVYANKLREQEQKKTGQAMPPITVLKPLLEPIAAAHAYCVGDEREELRIMVYDLGGGTFDTTVLEKRSGGFDIVRSADQAAFGGDPLLGGYNFDKAIADRLLAELMEHYNLELDIEEDPNDKCRYAKLLYMAEEVKLKVCGGSTPVTEIHESNIFTDKTKSKQFPHGRPVNIHNRTFSRKEFDDLIKGHLEDTLQMSRQVLDKVNLKLKQLNEVILVGGSSKIEQIHKLIAKTPIVPEGESIENCKVVELKGGFGKHARLFKPELAVAIGAAYYTLEMQDKFEPCTPDGLELLRIPSETDDDQVTIEGRVDRKVYAGAKTAVVLRQDGRKFADNLDVKSAFEVETVLVEETINTLSIKAEDASGTVLAEYSKKIRHDSCITPDAGNEIVVFLTKTLYLRLENEIYPLAPEGTPLPIKKVIDLKAAKEGKIITIPLLEDMRKIADLGVHLESYTVQAGHPVDLTIKIEASGHIHGHSEVLVRGEKFEKDIEIRFDPRPVRNRRELLEEIQKLEEQYKEKIERNPDMNVRMVYCSPIKEKLDKCKRELENPHPDSLVVERDILDIKAKLDEFIRERLWSPTLQQFLDLVKQTLEYTNDITNKNVQDSERNQIKAIRLAGERAYEHKDKKSWVQINRNLDDVRQRVLSWLITNLIPEKEKTPENFVAALLAVIKEYREKGSEEEKNNTKPLLDEAERLIHQVDPNAPDAMKQLSDIRDRYIKRVVDYIDKGKPIVPPDETYTEKR